MKKHHAAGLFFILLAGFYSTSIHQAVAPPLSYGYTCGLISTSNTNVRFSDAFVNVSIIPDIDELDNLTHSIKMSSQYNLTNSADYEVCFLTSFVRTPWTPQDTYSSIPKNVTIEGESSMYNASIVYNITDQSELPEDLSSKYPSGFFSSFNDPQIDLINLTLAPHAELVLLVQISLFVDCWGHFFDFRYGLDLPQLGDDYTHLDGKLYVLNTSLLVKTDFLNNNYRSVSQESDTLVATWSIPDWDWGGGTTYPGQQLDDDVFNEYIGVQLWQSEYMPPTPYDGLTDPVVLIAFFAITAIILFTMLVAWSRWNK